MSRKMYLRVPLGGRDADAGVLVIKLIKTRPSGEGNETCLAPEKAIALIAKPGGRFQCLTEYPVEVPSREEK